MKQLITLLYITLVAYSFSQTWVSNNAVWHYDYWNLGVTGFYKIEHVGDSVIEGKSCKEFDIVNHSFTTIPQFPGVGDTTIHSGPNLIRKTFTYQSNDSVFIWDQTDFKLLYDFGAQVGDSWILSTQNSNFGCDDISRVEVIGVGTEIIAGNTYRYIDLESTNSSSWILTGRYNERFAKNIFPFPRAQECSGIVEWDQLTFKCFQDDDFSLLNVSSTDCEYQLNSLSIEQLTPNNKKLVKIVDQLGKPAVYQPNTLLFYIYNDGTSEKVFSIQ